MSFSQHSNSLATMDSFHQYLQSLNTEKKEIHFRRIAVQQLQPEDFEEIIDLRPSEDFAEDNIPSSLNVPVLSRSERQEIMEKSGEESRIISLVWSVFILF